MYGKPIFVGYDYQCLNSNYVYFQIHGADTDEFLSLYIYIYVYIYIYELRYTQLCQVMFSEMHIIQYQTHMHVYF